MFTGISEKREIAKIKVFTSYRFWETLVEVPFVLGGRAEKPQPAAARPGVCGRSLWLIRQSDLFVVAVGGAARRSKRRRPARVWGPLGSLVAGSFFSKSSLAAV